MKLVLMPVFHYEKNKAQRAGDLPKAEQLVNTRNKIWANIFWFQLTVSPTIKSSVINTTKQYTLPHMAGLPPLWHYVTELAPALMMTAFVLLDSGLDW